MNNSDIVENNVFDTDEGNFDEEEESDGVLGHVANQVGEQYNDRYVVSFGNFIDPDTILSVSLPKMNINLVNNKPHVKHSNVVLAIKDAKNVCSNILKASTVSGNNLKVDVFEDEEKTIQTNCWEFKNAKIIGINFGDLSTTMQPEPRSILVEFDYTNVQINDTIL